MKRIILLAVLVAGFATVAPARAVSDCQFIQSVQVCYYADAQPGMVQANANAYDFASGNQAAAGGYGIDDPNYRVAGGYGVLYVNGTPVIVTAGVFQDLVSGNISHNELVFAGTCYVTEYGWVFSQNSYGGYNVGCY